MKETEPLSYALTAIRERARFNKQQDELPEWLVPHKEAWDGYVQMRKATPRVPFTQRAQNITIKELDRLRTEGFDPTEVLDQSTQRGWKGVFPVYGQQPKRVLRDQHGSYEVTAEGFRRYIQLQ